MPRFTDRLAHAWNVFRGRDAPGYYDHGPSFSYRPDRKRLLPGIDRSIVNSIITRIAIDCAAVSIQHVRTDENGRFLEPMSSQLQQCLTVSANTDQTGRALIQDIVMSMLDEGVVAIVPVETNVRPTNPGAFDITCIRTGRVTQWKPKRVRVELYNEYTGNREEVEVAKASTPLPENPLYSVMNGPNSTLQRLCRKLNLLDIIDEQSSSGKLDLIIQLPYVIKSEMRMKQAEQRRQDIEKQLAGSKFGIAYIDGTEKVTQLNRPIENNLMSQVEYLTKMLYGQLGMTEEVLNGTADEKTMLNYYNRTIEPILSAICDEMRRKFLTKTARTQFQTIGFWRDPFKLAPLSSIAEIADKFVGQAILSPNEIRGIIGFKPVDDQNADALMNRNINLEPEAEEVPPEEAEVPPEQEQDLPMSQMTMADLKNMQQ